MLHHLRSFVSSPSSKGMTTGELLMRSTTLAIIFAAVLLVLTGMIYFLSKVIGLL